MQPVEGKSCLLCKKSLEFKDKLMVHNEDCTFHRKCIWEWNGVHTKYLQFLTTREQIELPRYCPACKTTLTNDDLRKLFPEEYIDLFKVHQAREATQKSAAQECSAAFMMTVSLIKEPYILSCCHNTVNLVQYSNTLPDKEPYTCTYCESKLSLANLYHVKGFATIAKVCHQGYCCACGEADAKARAKIPNCIHLRCCRCDALHVPCSVCLVKPKDYHNS